MKFSAYLKNRVEGSKRIHFIYFATLILAIAVKQEIINNRKKESIKK